MAILSMPVISSWIEKSLIIPASNHSNVTPRFIFVLGGGYLTGVTPEEDILVTESIRRVLRGVAVWKQYPSAKLVFSGASNNVRRQPERHSQLMAALAKGHDVPAGAIIMEINSTNTATHPIEALKLSDLTSEMPIAVVTNAWHMRRAMREFCRHFENIMIVPVPSSFLSGQWHDWLPGAGGLDNSTTYIREWVGLLWYALKGMVVTSEAIHIGEKRC